MNGYPTVFCAGIIVRYSLCVLLALSPMLGPSGAAETGEDLAAARALFVRNLQAIENKDRDAYLDCYLEAPTLARTGAAGSELGFEGLSAAAGESWPTVFEGTDLQLVRVREGTVYGTYRYRVVIEGVERLGISERLFVKTAGGWKIAVTSAFDSPAGTPPPPRALVGATLIDGSGREPIENAVVLMRGGKIDCAGSRSNCVLPDGIEATDVSGRFITPGLIDTHVHYSQTGWIDGRPDVMDLRHSFPYDEVIGGLRDHPERISRALLCSGVTTTFDVGGYPWTVRLQDTSMTRTDGPRVVAAGPLLSTLKHWVNLPGEKQFIPLLDGPSVIEGVRYLDSLGSSAVKVWYIPVEGVDATEMRTLIDAVGVTARKIGLPLIVHATDLSLAKSAVRAGAQLLVHSVWDTEVDQEFVDLLAQNGTIYCPTLTAQEGYSRLFESALTGEPPAIDDPNGCIDAEWRRLVAATPKHGSGLIFEPGFKDGKRRAENRNRIMVSNLALLHEARIPIALGTDAGNPLTPHGPSVYAEMEAMQAAGMKPADVLASATWVAAEALGLRDEVGTLEPGKTADLLVLAADPLADIANMRRLELVVRAGVLRSIAELAGSAEDGEKASKDGD